MGGGDRVDTYASGSASEIPVFTAWPRVFKEEKALLGSKCGNAKLRAAAWIKSTVFERAVILMLR